MHFEISFSRVSFCSFFLFFSCVRSAISVPTSLLTGLVRLFQAAKDGVMTALPLPNVVLVISFFLFFLCAFQQGYMQISPASTSAVLNDKNQFPYFGRPIPSDDGTAIPVILYYRQVLNVKHLAICNGKCIGSTDNLTILIEK